jgi:thiosulfate dehydrogenase (quinone) large subunit
MKIRKILWLKLRLVMALIFLWAFFDKALGLGFSTARDNSWLNGGSPTYGFLTNSTKGPFAELFQGLAGVMVVDWLFMLGLLFVGLTLLLRKFIFFGTIAGSLMLLLMYLATFPPANNPLLDSHIVYILVLVLLAQKSKET